MASLLALLLASSNVRAGTYVWQTTDPNTGKITAQSPSFSGGTAFGLTSGPRGPFNGPIPYSSSSSNTYGGLGRQMNSPSCSGAITATLTWQADPAKASDPPPPSGSVVVMETSTARASAQVGVNATCSAQCDDGMGQPGSTQSSSGVPNYYNTATPPQPTQYLASVSTTDTRYTVSGGATITLTLSPTSSASASAENGPGGWQTGAGVSYTVSVYPVTVGLGGPVQDSSGNWNILVGQGCTASLSGIPSALLNNTANPPTYQWSVSGTTFQSWAVSADQTATTEVDGPGILTNPTAQWFWNDNLGSAGSKAETVTCTATVTPPSGQGAAFSVTASQPVTVWVPVWSESGTGDGMYVVNRTPTSSPDFWVEAGPTPGGNDEGGMNWMGSVHSPLPATFSDGTLTMAQLVIPGNSIVAQGMHYHVSNNGQEGLDTSYPYPNENTGNTFASHDSPGIDLTNTVAGCAAYSAVTQNQFEDYALFTPPGSSQCVPLGHFVWSTNGNVTEPYQGNIYDWAYFGSGSAGSMSPSGTRFFVQMNSFPSWTQNSGNNSYNWVGG